MDRATTKNADSTCDTASRSDLRRELADDVPAEIGDAITIVGSGDRIKVTVLGVIDPAVVASPGIKAMLRGLSGESEDVVDPPLRNVAVKLRMRNLEDASQFGVVHVPCGGLLIDADGHEYASTGDSIENCSDLWPPNRGAPPKLGCDCFKIPQAATPARYVLSFDSGSRTPAGEWRLDRSHGASAAQETDFGLDQQLQLLEKGVASWNQWRDAHPKVEIHLPEARLRNRDLKGVDLSFANLERADFGGSDLTDANLSRARARGALFPQTRVVHADFSGCDLSSASFFKAYADSACFDRATLTGATLEKLRAIAARFRDANLERVRGAEASLFDCDFAGCNLERADLTGAMLEAAVFTGVTFRDSTLSGAYLRSARLQATTLERVVAHGVNLQDADLTNATVIDSDLSLGILVNARLADATIVNTRVFGASVWDIQGTLKQQNEVIITPADRARVTVDDLEVANFVYLLLNNEKIRNAIETIGKKGVLVLGRFSERKSVLEAIKQEIARRDLLPIVFDFERPTDRDFTETVMTLAGMSRFIVADITAPRSVPLELQATVPNYMVPFVPLLQEGERPFSMFEDLWKKYRDWVLEPLRYESVEQLVRVFGRAVIDPANERLDRLTLRKAEKLVGRHASEYE